MFCGTLFGHLPSSRWVCTSGRAEDLATTDRLAREVLEEQVLLLLHLLHLLLLLLPLFLLLLLLPLPSEAGELLRWFDCADYMREPSDIAVGGSQFYVCDFKVGGGISRLGFVLFHPGFSFKLNICLV